MGAVDDVAEPSTEITLEEANTIDVSAEVGDSLLLTADISGLGNLAIHTFKQRVKALIRDARIILFDEPTTSLTRQECRTLYTLINKLREDGHIIVYISHNLEEVMQLADSIAVLRDGRLVRTGPKSDFTIDSMITDMVGREITQFYPTRISIPAERILLEVENLSQRGIVKDITFSLHAGEILGLFGLMGSGRSELARILYGLDPFQHGSIKVAGRTVPQPKPRQSIRNQMAFITENRREEGLLMEANIVDNLALIQMSQSGSSRLPGFIDKATIYRKTEQITNSLRIKADNIQIQSAKNLSGGNQQKVVIGKWLLSEPSVLIMDEPTRGIDVGAKYEVYNIMNDLAAREAGILCISSELEELMGICDRILVMSNGQIQDTFERNQFEQEKILHAAFQGRRSLAV